MADLQAAAETIEKQLQLANQLAWEIDFNAHNGMVVEDGTVDAGYIQETMVTAYNDAISNVLNTEYLTAQDVLLDQHDLAINNMHTAIDNLVEATAVLQTVSTVADMAADAATTDDQLQVQATLATTDMSIQQEDVDNFNDALTDVQTFAQQAGAFLAAANDTGMTDQIDNFAAQNNIAMSSYTAVSYVQDVDELMISFADNNSYIAFQGYMTGNTKTAAEIYDAIGYTGG
jgi:hypothetical protein